MILRVLLTLPGLVSASAETESETGPRLLPEAELVGFSGLEVDSLRELLGQAVLVDFFAHWCAPCARAVPRLSALQERYGDQGLVVLGVTADARETAEPWLERHGATYAYAFDPELRLQIELGFRSLPFAVLLDRTGVIVWSGDPAQLEDWTLEATLDGADRGPVAAWPTAASAVVEALVARRMDVAQAQAQGLADEALRAETLELVRAIAAAHISIAEAALAQGDYLTARAALERLPSEQAAEATEALRVALLGEGAPEVLAAQERLLALWREVSGIASRSDAEEMIADLQAIAATHAGTYVETQAAAYEGALRSLQSILR